MTDIPTIFCKITIIVMNTETSGKLNILIMFGKLHYTYYYSVNINCTLIVESLRIRAEVIYEWMSYVFGDIFSANRPCCEITNNNKASYSMENLI